MKNSFRFLLTVLLVALMLNTAVFGIAAASAEEKQAAKGRLSC